MDRQERMHCTIALLLWKRIRMQASQQGTNPTPVQWHYASLWNCILPTTQQGSLQTDPHRASEDESVPIDLRAKTIPLSNPKPNMTR